jgi:hypothetical protein
VREHELKLAAVRKVVEQRMADSRREGERDDQKRPTNWRRASPGTGARRAASRSWPDPEPPTC